MSTLTRSCRKILQVMKVNELSTAQEIHAQMRAADSRAPGLSTVYRSLDWLLANKYLQAVDLGDGERRYETVRPGEHHHHLICEICHAHIHLNECLLQHFSAALNEKYGFRMTEHVLEIFGKCKECLQPKSEHP